MGFLAAAVVWGVGGVAITLGAGPLAAGLFGISQTGVVAGSLAASAQAFVGNVAAGSVLAQLTSIAMLAPTP
jgi:hypothetical protein